MTPTTLITGGSSGIGAAAAVELTRRGVIVLITGRSTERLAAVHRRMVDAAPDGLAVPEPVAADFASLAEVRRLAELVRRRCPDLSVLANNAAAQPSRRRLSADGFELGFAVNHLAPFMLTVLLADLLNATGTRVITTSSSTHRKGDLDLTDLQMERGWSSRRSYGRSKLANILFTVELRRRTGLPATSFHPGDIRTDINRDSPFVKLVKPFERFLLAPPDVGADTLVWLATGPQGADPQAVYYVDRKPQQPAPAATDPELAARLWQESAALTGVGLATPADEGHRR